MAPVLPRLEVAAFSVKSNVMMRRSGSTPGLARGGWLLPVLVLAALADPPALPPAAAQLFGDRPPPVPPASVPDPGAAVSLAPPSGPGAGPPSLPPTLLQPTTPSMPPPAVTTVPSAAPLNAAVPGQGVLSLTAKY